MGAIASQQSQTLDAYETLENQYKELDQRFRNKTIERPDNWGGIVINPERFEFWQVRPNRLHDRFIYQRDDKKNWQIERLYP